MKKNRQRFPRHDPDKGVFGDCYRTAVACLLDLEPENVPHVFFDDSVSGEDGCAAMNNWLRVNCKMQLIRIAYPGETDLSDILSTLESQNPGVPYILGCTSNNGHNHSVVCWKGEVWCDPNDGGVAGPMDHGFWEVEYLGALLPHDYELQG